MYIFNQGKYKSLHAQSAGELDQIRQQVLSDKQFRPTYHLAADTGLLNDPNGLIFDGKNYHIFYQWFPYDAIHGMKHWQHLITENFQQFTYADPLIPDQHFESHGCYSGGAILWQDNIIAFYTGNTRNQENQRIPYQNIAIFTQDGKLLEKRCLLSQVPEGYTEHVRDPKPFITAEGKIRFILGAQRKNGTGTALLYEMPNIDSSPQLLGELSLTHFDNQHVFMWECPDLFQLADKSIFIWSPQGKVRETHRFQNNYHATYAVGKLHNMTFHSEHIEELDYGFDFYAPQTVYQSEGILYGWVGLPDLTYPTDHYQWHSMLSLPRQLTLKQNRLYQRPIAQIYTQLGVSQVFSIQQPQIIAGLDTAYLMFEPDNQDFEMAFFNNNAEHRLIISYRNGLFSLDRTQTKQTEIMQAFGTQRHCEISQLNKIEIFFDRSVIEIFLNDGEKVMTSRFFIEQRENQITCSRPIQVSVAQLPAISIT
ncbi:protein ScrB [Pasteurella canis]|uniref:Sucrose-6-phosphate hydrolase n=1 Tax=Pasteurella canis TaxID=753 RepID=A0A379EW38_9PAST|nr:glycoside hydrolase family 32 protein [Pasteurella canis]SUC10522.1 protein ScrB [Pasteurella canis]